MTTKATITSEGGWKRKMIAAQDAVEVTTTETCRFEILDRSGNGVILERQYGDTVVTAGGRGATAFPPRRLSEPWFCSAEPPEPARFHHPPRDVGLITAARGHRSS